MAFIARSVPSLITIPSMCKNSLALDGLQSYIIVVTKQELLLFSWDERKNQSNYRKRGVSFAAASLVFDDPFHLSRLERVDKDEMRRETIGMSGGVLLLLVARTCEEAMTGEAHIRIISAGRATKFEGRIYEEGS
jgi:uncharacterized protein